MNEMGADRMLNEGEYAISFTAVMDKKAAQPLSGLWLDGLMAGVSIALAAYGYLVAQAVGAGKLGGAVVFCAGLVMVVLLQAELFTGNMILGVGAIGRRFGWGRVLRNWGWVYVSNFAASLLLAYALYVAGGVDHSELGTIAEKVMHAKTSRTVPAYFVRGICCNLLVVSAYVMALFARDVKGKVLCILFPVTLFVLCGFEHCVANMFLIPFGLLVEGVPPGEWFGPLFGNLIPVTAGNVLGGVIVLFLQPRFIKMTRAQHENSRREINE
jgi:formate/nitrite transporter